MSRTAGPAAGRRRRHAAGRSTGLEQLPFRQFRNTCPPLEILDDDQIEAIHRASLTVLEEIGVNFLLPEAREILGKAGAEVDPDSTRVRFERGLIEQAVATAPSEFTLHARNPTHNLVIGGDHLAIATVSSPPNCSDIERGRRSGNWQDYCDFLRLAQSLNIAQFTVGHPVEPIDRDAATRYLDATLAKIELTDKLFGAYSLGRQRVLDAIEMARIARGVDEDRMRREPGLFTNVNANSPLQFDKPMLWGMIEMARRNQPVVVTPFTLAGAMAPVTLAGALAQQNAEALAGIAFLQIVNPGTPVVYGGFTSNVDMRSGSPAFGTPENAKATVIGGQLARRYGVPYRSSNVNASNVPDAQAVYESQMTLWPVFLAHANFLHHGLGWLEGGLCASFEKFIIDAEMLQMMTEFFRPVTVDEAELGLEAIREVGPGGHFFACAHTMERYEHAFYRPLLSDWRNFGAWTEAGSVDATHRANRIYKQLLAEYQPPALDPAIREALRTFVERRKAEGGAPLE